MSSVARLTRALCARAAASTAAASNTESDVRRLRAGHVDQSVELPDIHGEAEAGAGVPVEDDEGHVVTP